ncbi:MAG: TadE/TadG family type IV pilus assembly protein [Acidimicrobiales bacterium]
MTRRSERGSITAFFAVLSTAMFVMVGVVVDGARAIELHRQLTDNASAAARLGADQLSIDALRQGQIVVDPEAAVAKATTYLAGLGEQGQVTVSGDAVTVRVSGNVQTSILAMVGVDSIPESAVVTATNLQGVTEGHP